MIFKIIGGKAVRYDSGGTDKIDDSTVDFSQAESRENIAPTDTMKIILGKIMKWFSDLSAGAASSLLGQNLTAGKVLVSDDGGKVAASVVDASKVGFLSGVTSDIQTQINSLNSAMKAEPEFFVCTPADGVITEKNFCFYNPISRQVHILVSSINITGTFKPGTAVFTVPEKYRPKNTSLCVASIRKDGEIYTASGTVYSSGILAQNITSNGIFTSIMFVADYCI